MFAVILSLALTVQTLFEKYGADWPMFAYWGVAVFAPPLAILTPAAFSNSKEAWKSKAADSFKFRNAQIWSLGVWASAAAILLLEPLLPLTSFEVFGTFGVLLALVQARALHALGTVVFDGR